MRPEPQYGVQLSVADIPLELPIFPIYGVSPSSRYIPIAVDNDGKLSIGNVTITGPVTINDVVIKGVDPDNGNTSEDFGVYNLGSGNGYAMRSTLFDGGNHLKIESDGSADVYITGTGIAIPVTIDHALDSVAIYGTDGSTDRFIKTDVSGNLQVGIVGGTLAVTQSTSPWVISGTVTANAGTGTFLVDGSAHTQPVSGTFFQATQPISGTVTVIGNKTNNNATPGTTNIGVLPALANAVAPTWTEGDQVLLSEDLSGRLRIDNTSWLGSTAPTVGQKTSANSIPVVIASDQSDVGINIDKYGGTSTTLGQKVMTSSVPVTLASDQPTLNVSITGSTDLASGKVFYAAIDNYNLATASVNNPIFLFKNPIGSGKTMNIFSVTGNCKVSNVQVTFLMFKNPTVTANGSAFTPVNANFGSGNTSVVNVFTGSTVSSSGTLVVIDQVGQNANSSNMIITEQIAVPPGQTVLISGDPFSNNRAIIETVGWSEN